jgi:hypothetical protein
MGAIWTAGRASRAILTAPQQSDCRAKVGCRDPQCQAFALAVLAIVSHRAVTAEIYRCREGRAASKWVRLGKVVDERRIVRAFV